VAPGRSEGPVLAGEPEQFPRPAAQAYRGQAAGVGREARAPGDGEQKWAAVPAEHVPADREDGPVPSAAGVLADRLAAALVHHEPGWRLPRHTALARRFNVSTAQIDAAVEVLAARHLIRRLPDGQLYRASPAEYLLPLEGVSHLVSHVDPMGRDLACRSRQISWRKVPEDIGWALGIASAESVCVVRFVWTADGEPAALSTTYLPRDLAGRFTGTLEGAAGKPGLLPLTGRPGIPDAERDELVPVGQPSALHVEMQPPPPSVARSLRLSAGQPAAMVTVRFDDPATARPVALTVAVLRPDLFRIVVQSAQLPLPDGREGSFSGAWTHAVEDWEP
jgi:DNA-binding GntR family transcriptional regulator